MIFKKFNKKNNIPQLDSKAADDILQNVLHSCGQQPNTIPLKVLERNHKFRRFAQSSFIKLVSITLIATVCVTPLLLTTPSFTVTEITEKAYKPVYEIDVDSWMPVSNVTATLNGKQVSLKSPDTHLFTVEPATNGDLCITVHLINGRSASRTVQVTEADSLAPVATVEEFTDNTIRIHVSDEYSGLNYETLYGIDDSGTLIAPLSVDWENGIVIFPYNRAVMHVYVQDIAGNQLHMTITPTLLYE